MASCVQRPDTLDGVRRAADAEWCGGAALEWLGAAKGLRDGPCLRAHARVHAPPGFTAPNAQ